MIKFTDASLSLIPPSPHSSQFEEKFEEINGVELPTSFPSSSGIRDDPAAALVIENTAHNVELQGQDDHRTYADPSASQDFVSGIMKIVPSDVDVSLFLSPVLVLAPFQSYNLLENDFTFFVFLFFHFFIYFTGLTEIHRLRAADSVSKIHLAL